MTWDDIFKDWPHTPAVEARIRRLNPSGPVEGERPRGWHPAFTYWRARLYRDIHPVWMFNAKYGRNAHKRLPRKAIIRYGKRRFVTSTAYLAGPEDVIIQDFNAG